MSDSHGQFCWCELMTTDPKGAVAFYSQVIGWTPQAFGPPHEGYTVMRAGAAGVGGITAQPEEVGKAGMPPFWMGYIGVDDVESAAATLKQAGGMIHRPPGDIEGVGRFAVVADPHGAVFIIFKPLPMDQDMPTPNPNTPGHVGWHELHAGDREAAFAFYAGQFGWTKTQAIDLGPMGIYQTFATNGSSGPDMIGGMMTKVDAIPAPVWLHYFNVEDINAAAERARAAGGAIMMGPHEVPGGSWIVQCRDPQGAMFAMVAPPKAA
jgi:uncharacterized protein